MVIPLKLFLFAKIVNKYSIFHLKFLRNDSSAFIFVGRINKHQPFNEPSSEMPKLLNVSKRAMIMVLGRHFKRTPGWIENSSIGLRP